MSTLNGHRVTSARITIPSWGCWHASVDVDGEHPIANGERVKLVVADATFHGAVLSGGVALGRSFYRIVAGAGGWGRTIPPWSWSDDAGVKFSTAIGDAAREAGETLAPIAATMRTGPSWTRDEGPASQTLNTLATGGWYVDEAGVTHVGARSVEKLPAKVTRVTPVDLARGKAELASDSIAAILPGVVVDGLTATDVQHDISADGGLRTTVWGRSGADSVRRLVAALDPNREFRGPSEYRVDVASGNRLHLQPLRSWLPYLKNVPVRPGVAGCDADVALGSFVVVEWLDADPSRPFVSSFADVDADRFQPTALRLLAGGSAGGERVMTTEATALFMYNTLVTLMAAAGGGPLLAAVLQPLLGTAIGAALTAQVAPAPLGRIPQTVAAALLQAGFAAGTTPSPAMFAAWTTIIDGAAKTSNASGMFPGIGAAAVETG
ncbi:MAG TPA: hypothetical protein VNJ04_05150 [Gemmatimonadaceae bacterium]|nr:hypothetical protein [Gemmatimonadaceae bacterium]